MKIDSNTIFATTYNKAFRAIISHKKERYTFTGGRASCKSSFISLVIVILIVMFPSYNALILRKTAKTLRHSVFEQIVWAINKLGFTARFKIPKSQTAALPISYIRKNGQTQYIIFAGSDDPEKLKSIKVSSGYFAILWVEEKTEFTPAELQNIKISVLRGGETFYIFESYNPPSAARHWCNREAATPDINRMVIHTTYQDIPREWLGDAILHDIEQTKQNNLRAYENIYLGIVTGTGQNVFENVELREITDEEIAAFDYLYNGIDWGYYPDPFAFSTSSFNANKQTLYIFDELYMNKQGNYEAFQKLSEHMKTHGMNIARDRITADSAEPKSIADFRTWGGNVRGAIKGIGSREAGFKWLQGLKKIVIDPARCPHIADEFTLFEYEIDKRTGEIMSGYPQGQPDHGIDTVRYSLESVWRHGGE
ncbi:PBSX family phage terminase large subunit [Treponema denticola]|uniref:PBSX family phage terminase large subunit n=1 Tax=Treponema denticola TaxID=158 RepID=UPI0002B560CB|nr:PBSX family phage terminase large subunit [Treponema denticola]EMB43988.1 PBSX family phage terminase, large subunit [Treponema denticola AL-2]